MTLKPHQISTLIIIERVTASVSVIATLILISSFVFIKAFRTLSNTLIFYASFANLFANVAALIGGSALSKENSPLCQFQGFLLEMFMQSDPMWSCAMAVNVYLVFFRRYDAIRLKKLYWIYGVICYGVPFIPAMFCLFYKTRDKGKMYGNATLWCWIDNDYAAVRIYSYYAPIWVSILATFVIYIRVGAEIFQKRSQLRAAGYGSKNNQHESVTINSVHEQAPENNPAFSPFSGLRTTEIEVSTDPWTKEMLRSPATAYARGAAVAVNSSDKPKPKDQYSVTISSANGLHTGESNTSGSKTSRFVPKRPSGMDKIKWAYTRCAMLFAISILITWVPASVNRVYGLRYPHNPSFALNVGSALVLPLQGFWNTIIYFMTSMGICRTCLAEYRDSKARNRERKIGMKVERDMDTQHLSGSREGVPATSIGIGTLGRGDRTRRQKGSDSTIELSDAISSRRDDSESC